MDKYFDVYNDFFYNNIFYVTAIITGLAIVFCGVLIPVYKVGYFAKQPVKLRLGSNKWLDALDRLTSIFPLNVIKRSIRENLAFNFFDEHSLKLISNIVVLALAASSILIVFIMKDIGQLWYVKILLFAMCLVLPYYVLSLALDLYKYRVNKQIPKMIDEFRSAFIKHMKVKPALKECSSHIDKNLAGIISRAADSAFIEEGLNKLREKFNNVWFNIFVTLIINYKSNGGELTAQLYKLNKTMTRYINVEKKKNKRLIWYELFAVSSSVISIPAVFWLNSTILGSDTGMVVDAQSNIIISRIIGFSIVSLIIIRVLRKL